MFVSRFDDSFLLLSVEFSIKCGSEDLNVNHQRSNISLFQIALVGGWNGIHTVSLSETSFFTLDAMLKL